MEITGKTITDKTRTALRNELKKVLPDIEKKLGISIDIGPIHYSMRSMEFCVKCTLAIPEEEAEASAEEVFRMNALAFGGDPDWYGREFEMDRQSFKVVGLNINARRNAFIIRDVRTGKEYVTNAITLRTHIAPQTIKLIKTAPPGGPAVGHTVHIIVNNGGLCLKTGRISTVSEYTILVTTASTQTYCFLKDMIDKEWFYDEDTAREVLSKRQKESALLAKTDVSAKNHAKLIDVGNDIAFTWGGNCYDIEIQYEEKKVIFYCIEHGEKFVVEQTFDEIKEEYDYDVK